MFVVGAIAAFIAQSMGLLADALDMLADAGAYAIALMAWHHGPTFKAYAARLIGMLLTLLGIGVLAGVMWRGMTGSMPEGHWMMVVSVISLIVNATVLYLLSPFRKGEVHLRATWLFTQADVIANLAVMVSGALVLVLHSPWPDWLMGAAIALYVLKEALGILHEAREAREAARAGRTCS